MWVLPLEVSGADYHLPSLTTGSRRPCDDSIDRALDQVALLRGAEICEAGKRRELESFRCLEIALLNRRIGGLPSPLRTPIGRAVEPCALESLAFDQRVCAMDTRPLVRVLHQIFLDAVRQEVFEPPPNRCQSLVRGLPTTPNRCHPKQVPLSPLTRCPPYQVPANGRTSGILGYSRPPFGLQPCLEHSSRGRKPFPASQRTGYCAKRRSNRDGFSMAPPSRSKGRSPNQVPAERSDSRDSWQFETATRPSLTPA